VGGAQFDQPLQTVVAVDDAAIQIVQVRGREPAAIQWHQRAQLGRNDRHDVQDHPFRTAAGLAERLDQLQALDQLLALGLAGGFLQVSTQLDLFRVEIDAAEHLLDRLGANADVELILTELVLLGEQLILGQQLQQLQVRGAGFENDVALEIQDLLQLLESQVDHQADAAWQRLQEPDVADGRSQFDVAHPLAADLRQRDLDAAFLTDDAAELHPLVLAAQALVVLDRAKDAGAEQAVALGLERAIVDRFGLLDLAERPGANLFRAGDLNADLVESHRLAGLAEDFHQLIHATDTSMVSGRRRKAKGVSPVHPH